MDDVVESIHVHTNDSGIDHLNSHTIIQVKESEAIEYTAWTCNSISLVPRLSAQFFFAHGKISGQFILLRAKKSWAEPGNEQFSSFAYSLNVKKCRMLRTFLYIICGLI